MADNLKVEACHKCKVYITLIDESFESVTMRKKFEKDHRAHPIGSSLINEIVDYINVDEKYMESTKEKKFFVESPNVKPTEFSRK